MRACMTTIPGCLGTTRHSLHPRHWSFERRYHMPKISRSGGSMAFGILLHVWGEPACFTRPEMKVERVSYDVMTPSAARGILEAIHWKPSIKWIVEEIHVLKPIRFQSIRRNEVGAKASTQKIGAAIKSGEISNLVLIVEKERQQRASTVLVDVS